MPFQDLREFMAAIEQRDLLRRVTREVDWHLEIGAIAHHLFKTEGRAALFERVKDADYPLLCGAIATMERYAIGLGMPPDYRALQAQMMHAFTHRIPPVAVGGGPCQENVLQGDDIDLFRYPTPWWHPRDGGRFIGTLGVVITRDPETGKQNAGIYREMILERDKHGLLAGQHALVVLQKCQARGEPMPVATCFGLDPATLTSSVVPFGYGEDEMELAGALRGEPVPLVRCKTVDLHVPAFAEFVFEGYVSPDRESWLEEGPFGEYTGYYAGERMKRPTVQLTAITHRDNPIMQGTLEGPAPNESDAMQSIIRATTAKAQLQAMGIPGVQDVWVYARDMLVVISLERQYYHGHAQQVIDAVLATLLHKWVIVVDGDVDVFDWNEVSWAMGTNVLPSRDIFVTDDRRRGFGLDPSIPPEARPRPFTRSSRIGVDATTQHKGYQWSTPVKPDAAMLQRVLDQWDSYGLGPREGAPAAVSGPVAAG